MRIPLDIPDALHKELKIRAAREKVTIKQLILRRVQTELRLRFGKKKRRITFPLVRSKNPGTLEIDNDQIYRLVGFP